jgi:hypothetical protein
MSEKFTDYVKRKEYQCKREGHTFDASNLNPEFIPYWETGQRVEVMGPIWNGHSETMRGYIGITTGWKPVFLLMRRVGDYGSSWTIGKDDKVIKVIPGKYKDGRHLWRRG